MYYGALKSGRPEENLERMQKFFEPFVSLPFDDKAAEVYGEIRTQLEKFGTPIGPNDLLIAAIAKANTTTLITNNIKEFKRVEGISLEDWDK